MIQPSGGYNWISYKRLIQDSCMANRYFMTYHTSYILVYSFMHGWIPSSLPVAGCRQAFSSTIEHWYITCSQCSNYNTDFYVGMAIRLLLRGIYLLYLASCIKHHGILDCKRGWKGSTCMLMCQTWCFSLKTRTLNGYGQANKSYNMGMSEGISCIMSNSHDALWMMALGELGVYRFWPAVFSPLCDSILFFLFLYSTCLTTNVIALEACVAFMSVSVHSISSGNLKWTMADDEANRKLEPLRSWTRLRSHVFQAWQSERFGTHGMKQVRWVEWFLYSCISFSVYPV